MASGPLTLGFITLIQALCQQSFGLTLPQKYVRVWAPMRLKRSGPTNGGRLFRELGLLVGIEPGKQVKRLAGPDHPEKAEGIA